MPRTELASVVTFPPRKISRSESRQISMSQQLPAPLVPPPMVSTTTPNATSNNPSSNTSSSTSNAIPTAAPIAFHTTVADKSVAPTAEAKRCVALAMLLALGSVAVPLKNHVDETYVNTTALVLNTEKAVSGAALNLLSGAIKWTTRACVYTGEEQSSCTSMLNHAHEYMRSQWLPVQPIPPLHADVHRIGRMLHIAVSNITMRITANLTDHVQEVILRHALAPILSSLFRLIKPTNSTVDFTSNSNGESTDDSVESLVDDVLAFIEERI